MRKVFALLIAVVLIFSSCSDNEPPKMKTADMLDITNTDKDFQGCKCRMNSVLSAMKAKVSILENAHNNLIKNNSEGEYFLEKDYVLTTFEPFVLSAFGITEKFNSDAEKESPQKLFEQESNSAEVVFETDGRSSFLLQFISEITVEEYSVEYNEKNDSFIYLFTVENENEAETREFLEFVTLEDGVYLIQSKSTRCIIEFDDEDRIVSFCCGELSSGEFSLEESVFCIDSSDVPVNWVLERGKSNYSNIHTYSSGVLTHEDCSSGPWKSVKISETNFASAFYAQ